MLFKRPFSCEYCKHYNSTYLEVTVNHWPVCDSYPVQCPNKCSDEILKCQNLESHIANDCTLAIVDCDFKGVGRLPRKDLCTHFNEGVVAAYKAIDGSKGRKGATGEGDEASNGGLSESKGRKQATKATD